MIASWLMMAALGLVSAQDAPKIDEALLGTWEMIGVEHRGDVAPIETFKGAVLIIDRDGFTNKRGDRVGSKGKYIVRMDKSPKEIDRTFTEGALKDKTQKGIYEIKDDLLDICVSAPGAPRPESFGTNKGETNTHWLFRKKK